MPNILEDTKRAANRAKVRRYRGRAALQEFTSTERRIALNLAAGDNDRQALVKAGSNYQSDQALARGKQALQAILDTLGMDLTFMCERVKALALAKKKMLTAEGCIDVDAWDAVARGVGYTIELQQAAGKLPKVTAEEHQGMSINFNLDLGKLAKMSQPGADNNVIHKRQPQTIEIKGQE